jgi:hypothetical protein
MIALPINGGICFFRKDHNRTHITMLIREFSRDDVPVISK